MVKVVKYKNLVNELFITIIVFSSLFVAIL